jgi:copper chaperone CopZ
MTSAGGSLILEFKALRVPILTEELATKLEARLNDLPGIEQLTISLETRELTIVFDENRIGFRTVVEEMTKAGCSLQNIDAALFM